MAERRDPALWCGGRSDVRRPCPRLDWRAEEAHAPVRHGLVSWGALAGASGWGCRATRDGVVPAAPPVIKQNTALHEESRLRGRKHASSTVSANSIFMVERQYC